MGNFGLSYSCISIGSFVDLAHFFIRIEFMGIVSECGAFYCNIIIGKIKLENVTA